MNRCNFDNAPSITLVKINAGPDLAAGLLSGAAWNVVVNANAVLAVIALYDEDSLLAFQSDGYESVDGTVKLFVPVLGLLHSDVNG
ncbi:hypothetical protein [Arthrobacter sp. D3-16]